MGARGLAHRTVVGMLSPIMKTFTALCLGLLTASTSVFAQDAAADVGKAMFMICSACHGPDGKGLVTADKKMAPSLVGSKIALGDPELFAAVVLKGIKKEGEDYLQMMAPLPLPDEQLAAVMTYVRSSFGNKAAAVTAEQVKGFREKTKDLPSPLTRAKIAELGKK